MTKLVVLATENGKAGPLDGPFTISIDAPGAGVQGPAQTDALQADLMNVIIGFVRAVAAGVSCYNKAIPEDSSNLKSYAQECFDDLKSEFPEAAARLENLVVDCSRLPQAVKDQPIWKLDRAILRMLPGATFIE